MSVKNVCSVYRHLWPSAAIAVGLSLVGFAGAQPPSDKPAASATPPADAGAKTQPSPSLFPNGLPKLEQFLTTALERHPEVVVARSKVEAARSELLKAEATALKELLQLHQQTQSKRTVLEMLLKQKATVPGSKLQIDASELSLLEWEIALALGFQGAAKQPALRTNLPGGQPDADAQAIPPVFVNIAYPKGNLATKVKEALTMELDADLTDATLKDVCTLITDQTGIQVAMDETMLSDQGFETDSGQFNLKTKGNSVASLLQQIEDRYRPLYFVVRDYGILVTIAGDAPLDAVSARDFANLSEEEIRDKVRAKLEADAQQLGGMGGGGGWGGGGGFF